MFRTLIHPSSGACDFSIASACNTDTTPTTHTETPTNIETRKHDQSGDKIENSQAPDDGCTGWRKKTHVFETAFDFFLWVYLKSKVYVWKPRTFDDLKVSIREEIATVPQEMLVNVMQNFDERLRTCVRQEGRHHSDIIFRNWVINISNQHCIYYRLFWC